MHLLLLAKKELQSVVGVGGCCLCESLARHLVTFFAFIFIRAKRSRTLSVERINSFLSTAKPTFNTAEDPITDAEVHLCGAVSKSLFAAEQGLPNALLLAS